MNCTAAFQDMLAKVELPPRVGSPPKKMPGDMVSDYLMNNQAHLRLWYESTVFHGSTVPHDWSIEVVEQHMSLAKKGDSFDFGPEDTATIYNALADYPVMDMAGLVVGSIRPWVEAILLVAGQYGAFLQAKCPCSESLTNLDAETRTVANPLFAGPQGRRA